MEELFRNSELLVRAVRPFRSEVCFVTFDSYSDLASLDRPGFGEPFFLSHGIDAIHLLSKNNNWYLYDFSAEAFEAVRQAVASYRRVVAYGSSMGGYAAIRFGRRVGAQVALAMSPQYSINPETPPFETRWLFDARAVDFSIEANFDDGFVERAYIFYDPRDADRLHVEQFRNKTQVLPVPVVNGGHPCTTMLAEIGLLQAVVGDIAAGEFDPNSFAHRLKVSRKRSAQLFYNISKNIRRPADQVRFARMAAELRPDVLRFLAHLGAVLIFAGDLAESKQVLDRALALDPEDQSTFYRLSEYYEAAGDLDRAIAIMDDLTRAYPHSRAFLPRLNELLDIEVERLYEQLFDEEARPLAVLVGPGPG
jgi:tetratricopeptide (TPR) repeat protein